MFGFITNAVEKMNGTQIQETLITSVVAVSLATVICFGLVNVRSCNYHDAKNAALQTQKNAEFQVLESAKDERLKSIESAKDERLKALQIESRVKVLEACKNSCGDKGVREIPADGSCTCD